MDLALLQLGLKALWGAFIFSFGACAGSLINVLVYRMPRGLDVVWTTSRCPACQTKLTWRENVPVLGWLMLRGRCRFCRSKISAEYPLVEALVGGLWVAMYVVYYALPEHWHALGVDWGVLRPAWALQDARFDGWPRSSWPIFLVHLFTVGSLVAMSLVDIKTFTIPLAIPWAATVVGLIFHVGGAAAINADLLPRPQFAPGANWAIPTPGWPGHTGLRWWWVGASIGGVAGLGLAMLFLRFRLIRRSFEDYAEWERGALKQAGLDPDAQPMHHDSSGAPAAEDIPVGEHVGPGVRMVLRFMLVWAAWTLGLAFVGKYASRPLNIPEWTGLILGFTTGPLLAALTCRPLIRPQHSAPSSLGPTASAPGAASSTPAPIASPPSTPPPSTPAPTSPELWIAYPHARREMLKELIFLTPCIGLAWLGGMLAVRWGGGTLQPLWLSVLTGVLMGYLIGGGVVWAIRIAGSLAFGKEAMGLGDVHLMAAVGAALGWVTASLAVPLAAVVGLYFVVAAILSGRGAGKAMPFGPYLAIASLLLLFGQPLVELGLERLLSAPAGSVKLP